LDAKAQRFAKSYKTKLHGLTKQIAIRTKQEQEQIAIGHKDTKVHKEQQNKIAWFNKANSN